MFMFGLVLVMFVCLFVRLVLVFRCILVVTAFVNWFTVWCFFPGSTGFCTYDKIVNIIIHFIEDSKTKKLTIRIFDARVHVWCIVYHN